MEIDEFLQTIIHSVNENSTKEELMNFSLAICEKMKSYYKYDYSNEIKERIYNLLFNYSNRTLTENNVTKFIKMEMNYNANNYLGNNNSNFSTKNNYSVTYGTNRSSSVKKDNQNDIIDTDTDIISEVTQEYSKVQETVNEIETNISLNEIKELDETIKEQKNTLNKQLSEVATAITDTMASIAAIDESIPEINFSDYNFQAMGKTATKWKEARELTKANSEFFEKCGAKVENDVVKFNGYSYNLKTKTLEYEKNKVKVDFFIPSSISNGSDLGTVTMLSGDNEKSVSDYSELKNAKASSIIIVPVKNKSDQRFTNSINGGIDGVASSTNFIKSLIKQNNNFHNIIVGCSNGGSSALRIAANSGDTYDSVVCVNNAALVTDKNAKSGFKEQFTSIEELEKLNGKSIYFFQTKDDPNLNHCYNSKAKDGWYEVSNVKDSYLYTGVELVLDCCDKSQVYLITNKNFSEFDSLNNIYKNFNYSSSYWNNVVGEHAYSVHGHYKNVVADLTNNGFFDNIKSLL